MAKGLAISVAVGKPKPKGDLGAPAAFGAPAPKTRRAVFGAAAAPPPPAADDYDTDSDTDTGMAPNVTVTPEAVSYRTASEQCNSCRYMEDDGNCQVLNIQVAEEDGCNAHAAREETEEPETPALATRGRLRGAYPQQDEEDLG